MPFFAAMIPICIVAIVAWMVVEVNRNKRSGTSPAVEQRLSRLEAAVDELREMVYDAVVEVDERKRFGEEPRRLPRTVDA